MATKPKKLGLLPTLVVLILALGLAVFVGVILLMMLVRTGMPHSPEQSRVEQRVLFASSKQDEMFSRRPDLHES